MIIMKTGIIGTGKVGCSLAKYFILHDMTLSGVYDADFDAAKEAAEFLSSSTYEDVRSIVESSDALFLTVPDGLITTVWNQIKDLPLEGKFICHCSGALSAGDAFPGISGTGAFGYSVHPLFAVSDKYHSYKELTHAYFTIEGEEEHLPVIRDMFASFGNHVITIDAKDKAKYHLASAICSNHIVALLDETISILSGIGFKEEDARKAISPLVLGNVNHVLESGAVNSLTGPVERCDKTTVIKHMNCLDEEDRLLYKLLSRRLVKIGAIKNPERDYSSLEEPLSY